MKHYIWSNLDYGLKKAGYRSEYHCGHYDGKGRIADWLTTKPFSTQADAFKWTVFTNGPYAEMLYGGNFLPKILDDGTRVFADSARGMFRLSPWQTSAISPVTFSTTQPRPLVRISS